MPKRSIRQKSLSGQTQLTAQIPDLFRYQGQDFSIAGISEGELFNPDSLDLKPVGVCTACWRGYQAIYAIAESRLVLQELNINLADDRGFHVDELGPPINGVMPFEPPGKHKLFRNAYKELLYQLPYTGGVLIADGLSRISMFTWDSIRDGNTKP